jgi:hypothetical protein
MVGEMTMCTTNRKIEVSFDGKEPRHGWNRYILWRQNAGCSCSSFLYEHLLFKILLSSIMFGTESHFLAIFTRIGPFHPMCSRNFNNQVLLI